VTKKRKKAKPKPKLDQVTGYETDRRIGKLNGSHVRIATYQGRATTQKPSYRWDKKTQSYVKNGW
jgi:hypothetical protein